MDPARFYPPPPEDYGLTAGDAPVLKLGQGDYSRSYYPAPSHGSDQPALPAKQQGWLARLFAWWPERRRRARLSFQDELRELEE